MPLNQPTIPHASNLIGPGPSIFFRKPASERYTLGREPSASLLHSFFAHVRKVAIDPRGTMPANGGHRAVVAKRLSAIVWWDENLENTPLLSSISKKIKKLGVSFHLIVSLPVALSLLYFYVVASDIYIAESSFVIRNSDSPKINGLGLILNTGVASSNDENAYAARAYMTSRDALSYLNAHDYVRAAYSRPEISFFDRFNSSGLNGTFEDLYHYFINKVQIEHDRSTAITTVRVRAYTPSDAHKINQKLMEQAEKVVNQLNERARADIDRKSVV